MKDFVFAELVFSHDPFTSTKKENEQFWLLR